VSRQFHIGDVLSVTTGFLVAPRGIEAMYDLLNFMTGDSLFTHQLPRASRECAPDLLRQHPKLAEVEVPAAFRDEAHALSWLAEQVAVFGERLDVSPLAEVDHTRIDPLTELASMVGTDRIIAVEFGDGEVSS
jgi:hypothetical protein